MHEIEYVSPIEYTPPLALIKTPYVPAATERTPMGKTKGRRLRARSLRNPGRPPMPRGPMWRVRLRSRGYHRAQPICMQQVHTRGSRGGWARAYSFVACISRVPIDDASLSRRSIVPTPSRCTSNSGTLIPLFPYTTYSFCFVNVIPGGEGGIHVVYGRSDKTVDPRTPTTPWRRHARFLSTRKALLAPSAKRRDAFGQFP